MNNTPNILNNGAAVIDYTEKHPGGNGYRRHGVALCEFRHGIGEYVTWIVYEREDGWHAESGHYCTDIIEATADYRERAGTKETA